MDLNLQPPACLINQWLNAVHMVISLNTCIIYQKGYSVAFRKLDKISYKICEVFFGLIQKGQKIADRSN